VVLVATADLPMFSLLVQLLTWFNNQFTGERSDDKIFDLVMVGALFFNIIQCLNIIMARGSFFVNHDVIFLVMRVFKLIKRLER
jgi:hypothetical protein